MMPPISTLTHVHWVDKIKIEIYPLIVEGKSNRIVKISFYQEDSICEKSEVTAFTNHKNVEARFIKKEGMITILIEKKEG